MVVRSSFLGYSARPSTGRGGQACKREAFSSVVVATFCVHGLSSFESYGCNVILRLLFLRFEILKVKDSNSFGGDI